MKYNQILKKKTLKTIPLELNDSAQIHMTVHKYFPDKLKIQLYFLCFFIFYTKIIIDCAS